MFSFFLCGPYGLIEIAEETLSSLDIPTGNIYKEYFSPAETKTNTVTLTQQPMEVLFHHIEQTNLLDVEPGKTILESALENRIPVNYSCKNGTCGACVAKVLEGQVHMVSNFARRRNILIWAMFALPNASA
jgi:ring-1,2-phenylacetyl-CoA epoxidase subunit PaaE